MDAGGKCFADLIAVKLNEIIRNFEIGLRKKGYAFDYDVFSNTYAKCLKTLDGKVMEEKDAVKYLWVAYMNNMKTVKKSKQVAYIADYQVDIVEVEDYSYAIDELYNYVIKKARDKFDENIVNIWIEHVCYGKTYKQILDDGYEGVGLEYQMKQIKKYIYNELQRDPHLQELLSNLNK